MLIAIPTWLARLIVGEGRFKRFLYFWARPVPALIVFNFLTALSHWAWIVNESIAERLAPLRRPHRARVLVAAGVDAGLRSAARAPVVTPPLKMSWSS